MRAIWMVWVFGTSSLFAGCPASPEPVFPEDWETSLAEARDCRQSIEHDLTYVRMLMSAEAVASYETCTAEGASCDAAFPDGSLFLKPEYRDSACSDLVAISVARKDASNPGLGADGWHWQDVSAAGNVRRDGEVTECIQCHARCDGSFDHRCRMDP